MPANADSMKNARSDVHRAKIEALWLRSNGSTLLPQPTLEGLMQKANAIGGILSIFTGIVWVLVGLAGWPVWLGVVISMAVGGYWAFGRPLVAGEEMGSSRARNRDRRR